MDIKKIVDEEMKNMIKLGLNEKQIFDRVINLMTSFNLSFSYSCVNDEVMVVVHFPDGEKEYYIFKLPKSDDKVISKDMKINKVKKNDKLF